MKIVTLVLLATQINAQRDLSPAKHRQLVLCILNIVNRYISAGHPLVVSVPDGGCSWDTTETSDETRSFMSHLLEEFHSLERWPIYAVHNVTPGSFNQGHTVRKYMSYIIIAPSFQLGVNALMNCLTTQVRYLQGIEVGNPKGVYLVVILNSGEVDGEIITNILETLWEWKVLDVIVITESESSQIGVTDIETRVDIFSWFPFQSPNHCVDVTDVILVDRWENGSFVKGAHLFPKKITRNLNRCPLVASTMRWGDLVIASNESDSSDTGLKEIYQDGLEVILYNAIVETFNMTTAFIRPIPSHNVIWGDYSYENNTYTGVIGDAKFGRSNVSFCGLPKNFFFETHVDSTHSYVESGFNWYVQCARPRPRWQVLVRTFALSVWTALVLSFFAVAIVIWRLAKFPDEHQEAKRYLSFVGTFQTLLAVFLNVGVNQMPLGLFLRGFFCLWVWSCFALTTVFQTFFTSFLVDPGLEKQVSNVEELLASNLVLTFDVGYLPLFEDVEERENLILSRWVSCPGFEACSRRTAKVGDAATILDFQNFDGFKHQFVDEKGDSLLCRLPGKISGYLIAMFMQKGNPLFGPVNNVILRVMEAGLVDFWWSLIVERKKFTTYTDSEDAPIKYFVFSMSHLYVAFTFLALGHCVSFVVFVLEVLWKMTHVRKSKNTLSAEFNAA